MDKQQKLSDEQLEYLKNYLHLFYKTYYFLTNKKLENINELVDLIVNDKITFEDVFDVYIDSCFPFGEYDEDLEYWEDNMEMFGYENYFPNSSKNIEDGCWIKIRNECGFEIHYAKRSQRKRRFDEEIDKVQKQLLGINKRLNTALSDTNTKKKVDEIVTPKIKERKKIFGDKHKELLIRSMINLKPYEVKINRTKSVIEYYLPYQYEIIKDIEEFSDAYVNSCPGVTAKALYTSKNEDIIFYLQSRGISRKTAEMMAALKQTYFKVNMIEAMDAYNTEFKNRVQIVNV